MAAGSAAVAAALLGSALHAQAQLLQSGTPLPQAPLAQQARVSGTVLSDSAALLSGARVALACPNATAAAETTTDAEGHFDLQTGAAGACTLRVTLQGFQPLVQTVTLLTGKALTLPTLTLSMASVSISVEAVTQEEMAAQELHAEEHQRLVGILPNFFVSYNWTAPPLSVRQKYTLATHNVLDPGNLALVGVVAGVQQADNAFPGYGQGAAGYGKRYGADLGNLVVGTYMGGAVLPGLFHQDPRYFFKGTGTLRSRALYALSRAVVTRGDNGHNQPNFSGVLGDLSAGALSNAYYPASDRQGAKLFLENGLLGVAGDAMNDLVQEFLLPHFTTRGKAAKNTSATSSAGK